MRDDERGMMNKAGHKQTHFLNTTVASVAVPHVHF